MSEATADATPIRARLSRPTTAPGVVGGEAPTLPPAVHAAHLVGICGSGMKALAEYLSDRDVVVTGSDTSQSSAVMRAMQRRGLRVHSGHHDRHLPPGVDVLVHSPAVGPDNPERRLATSLGIPQLTYSQMLGWLSRSKTAVAIAGTHGKSTTSAMVATILAAAGRDPSAIVGAELIGANASGWAGSGREFVVEACEYRRSFLDISPRHAVVLNVEPDHFDYYPTAAELQTAFGEFVDRVDPAGGLVVRADCARSLAASAEARSGVTTFGNRPGADWWIDEGQPTDEGGRYRVFRGEDFVGTVRLRVPGRHNALNAIAAAALCAGLDVPFASIRDGLEEFGGVRRRFEVVGSWRGATIVDDYAHHPTAVAASLRTARERFGQRRIVCAFQPHQVSRLNELMDEFGASFGEADLVLVAPVFAAREGGSREPYTLAGELAESIAATGTPARRVPSLDHLVATLDDVAAPGDVLITMGAGDIDRVRNEFTRRLRGHHQR